MGRCEGLYPTENRRCDRDGDRLVYAHNGEPYSVCRYHEREARRSQVARWQGESGLRSSAPAALVSALDAHPAPAAA